MKTLIAVIAIAGATAVVRAQSPQFEVVSVRRCQATDAASGRRQGGSGAIKSSPGRLNAECVTAEDLIREAWLRQASLRNDVISKRILNAPIEGSPAWLHDERFTVEATAQGNQPESDIRGPMLQALLESRFRLKIHESSKPIPVYELTAASGGRKLQPAIDGSCIPRDAAQSARKPSPQDRSAATMPCGLFAPSRRGGVDVNGASMAQLCTDLSAVLDRDVVDITGIAGLFDIHLDVSREQPATPGPPDPAQMFGELKAAVEKLGLKFEATTATGKFLVIDRIEKPSEN